MINCKDCQFWDTENSTYRSFGIGTCLAIPEEFYFDYDDETQLAYTDDVDNELSFLATRPNFGCVLGEKKET